MDKIIKCPRCGKTTTYSPANEYRPFCSHQCQLIDFGAWASDTYSIPGAPATSEDTEIPGTFEDNDT